MTLLEGHGEYVMNGVGPSVIPSVEEIGRKFGERRRGQSPADRLVRKLFGLDMKARQYAEGSVFVRAVVERAGMAAFNRVWTSPNTLPSKAEIATPSLWMTRVLRTPADSGPTGD
jgi:putative hydrolase